MTEPKSPFEDVQPGGDPARVDSLPDDARVVLLAQLDCLRAAADDVLLALECESCATLPIADGEANELSDQLRRIIRSLPCTAVAG